mmetsp:Transcript_25490/g.73608  ORF Transcript_25490/g.73608 Transcript_25490/m.73608 type:complete len:247 (+) Transcript_25490:401-1141(+)
MTDAADATTDSAGEAANSSGDAVPSRVHLGVVRDGEVVHVHPETAVHVPEVVHRVFEAHLDALRVGEDGFTHRRAHRALDTDPIVIELHTHPGATREPAIRKILRVAARVVGDHPHARQPEPSIGGGLRGLEQHRPLSEPVHAIHELSGQGSRLRGVVVALANLHERLRPALLLLLDLRRLYRHLLLFGFLRQQRLCLFGGGVWEGAVEQVELQHAAQIGDETRHEVCPLLHTGVGFEENMACCGR